MIVIELVEKHSVDSEPAAYYFYDGHNLYLAWNKVAYPLPMVVMARREFVSLEQDIESRKDLAAQEKEFYKTSTGGPRF